MEFMIPILNKYLNTEVTFLKDGLNKTTLEYLDSNSNSNNNTVTQVYLLENLRFNLIETLYENLQVEEYDEDNHNIIKNYRKLGDVFILDAFG